jgi:hypothetical protein
MNRHDSRAICYVVPNEDLNPCLFPPSHVASRAPGKTRMRAWHEQGVLTTVTQNSYVHTKLGLAANKVL